MTRTHRILITGSRKWPKPLWVEEIIVDYMREHWTDEEGNQNTFLVVHGDCPSGADKFAKQAVERLKAAGWPVDQDPHPAKWNVYGRRAGYVRNQEMVDLGADICFAFNYNHSDGTKMCSDLAESAGIPVCGYMINV